MKRFIALILVLVMVVAIVGCVNDTDIDNDNDDIEDSDIDEKVENTDEEEDIKIGVLIYKYDDTYISTVKQALESQVEGANIELIIKDGQGDQGQQNDQLDILIEKDVDALAVNIVDIGAANTVIEKVKEAEIPVVFFNREPDTEVVKSYEYAAFVGTKTEEAGILQGELMAKVWEDGHYDRNDDGKIQYVMLKGDEDNPEAIARTQYSIKTLNDKGIETEELGLQVANWDADKANQTMRAWFAKDGDKIEYVIANNDDMALGAISALQNSGYNLGEGDKYIPVFGVDATDEVKDLIKEGYMAGTVKQDGEEMAKAVLSLAINAAKGNHFLEETDYEYDDTGVSVRIPYQVY